MRTAYRRRREAVVAALSELLPDCRISGMAAGLHLLLELPSGTDATAVVERAAELQVGVVSIDRYRLRPGGPPSLVIGYGNLRTGRERQAVGLLARAIDAAARPTGR
jgi:GntR family transcriptional regulator/MocR family aminotransferase